MQTWRIAALLLLSLQGLAGAAEPRIFIMGVWPNRLLFFDEATEEIIGELGLRYGAVTTYRATAHTPSYDRLFFVTDRMEAVEVVDPKRQEVVDSLELSTPERRVRIVSVAANAAGTKLYLHARGTELGSDRFTRSPFELLLYDLETKSLLETIRLPDDVKLDFLDTLYVSPDGDSLFIIGKEVYELSTETHELVGVIRWSERRAPGYGPVRDVGLTEIRPGVFTGTFQTADPMLGKAMTGIVELDLRNQRFDTFELGPALNVNVFALSPDGTRGFAGLGDLAVVDMGRRRVIARKEGFERGRTNNTIIVSADGTEIYVTGVGDAMKVYDARNLELRRTIPLGADIMSAPLPLPRNAVIGSTARR